MATSTSYRFIYLESQELYSEKETPELTKVNEIRSFFSETLDNLLDSLPNLNNYRRSDYNDNHKGEKGISTYGPNHLIEMAVMETRLKFDLMSKDGLTKNAYFYFK